MRTGHRHRLSGLPAFGLCGVLACGLSFAEETRDAQPINTAAKPARDLDTQNNVPGARTRKPVALPPLPNDPVFTVEAILRDARDKGLLNQNPDVPGRGESQSVKPLDWRVPKEEPSPAPRPIPTSVAGDPEDARIAATTDDAELPPLPKSRDDVTSRDPVTSRDRKGAGDGADANKAAPSRSRLADPEAGRFIEPSDGVELVERSSRSVPIANGVLPSNERSGSSVLQKALPADSMLVAGAPESGPRIESGSALDKDDPKPVLQEKVEKLLADSLAKPPAPEPAAAPALQMAPADAKNSAQNGARAMKLKLADSKTKNAFNDDPDETTRKLTHEIAERMKEIGEMNEAARKHMREVMDSKLGGMTIRDEDQLKVVTTMLDSERRVGAIVAKVFDAKTKEPLPARVCLRDTTDSTARAPLPDGFWFRGGVTPPINLVSGPVRVEISHGGRFVPPYLKGIDVKPGQVAQLDVPLARPMELDFEGRGWVLADLDIGLRKRAGENSIWFGPAPTMADLILAAKCEGVRVIGVTLPLGDEDAMAGVRYALEHPNPDVLVLPVFPGPRNRFNGSGMGLGVTSWDDLKADLTQPEIPLREGFENIRARGGLAVFTELKGTRAANIERDIFPVYTRLKDSDYFGRAHRRDAHLFAANELPFDTVTGAYDLLAFDGSDAAEAVWFNLLNEGAPVRVIGAGGGSLEGGRIPYGQTFVQVDGAQSEPAAPASRGTNSNLAGGTPAVRALTREGVLDAIKAGRTMVSFGPAVFAKVFERDMGPGSVLPPDGRELQLQIQAYSTVTASAQLEKIEIIRNGQVVYTQTIAQNGGSGETEIHDLRWPLKETHDAWYIVRVTERSKSASAGFGNAPRRAWTSPIFFRSNFGGAPASSRLDARAPVAQARVHGILRRNLTPMRGAVTALAAGMPTRRVETGPDGSFEIKVPATATLVFEAPECEPVAKRVFEHPSVQRGVGQLAASNELVKQLSDRAAFGMWRLLLSDLEWDITLAPMELPVVAPEKLPEPE